jgi:hypothetical protein
VFVFVVVGRPWGHDRRVLAVFASELLAQAYAARWKRQHPRGEVECQRFAVIEGSP